MPSLTRSLSNVFRGGNRSRSSSSVSSGPESPVQSTTVSASYSYGNHLAVMLPPSPPPADIPAPPPPSYASLQRPCLFI
ncbi:hypothetical protein P167DRAFT_538795 [Morchella conica CCBAS932]|uniref:Uncharacterized protein n=1 Tax=Morchella conica CCBAS932 TaxID=1392247 RepID=A0A3N4KTB8_9PEZI|nr:hypothetical protein P167DRAFT_538795 [Morchella conica CCBAS932]